MNETRVQHTAGPWDRDGADFIYGPDGKFIASMCLGAADGDAALIAAAPDLLAALEAVHRIAGLGSPPQMSADTLQAALIDIRSVTEAAIAKARGDA